MPRSLRFSQAAYQSRSATALLEPLICLVNIVVASWLYPAWRTTRIHWEPDVRELIHLFKARSRPIICFAWHKYELIGACVFKDFPNHLIPVAIGHDGFWSRALQQTSVWYHMPMWVYRRKSPIKPKAQLINLLRTEKTIIGLFPDSGGPDGQIRNGFVEVARSTEALLIPMVWHAKPVFTPGGKRCYCFPVPFSEVTAVYGKPMDGNCVTPDDCRQALEQLENHKHFNFEKPYG